MKLEQKQVISFSQVPKYVKKGYLGLKYLSIFILSFPILLDLNTSGKILLFL